MYLCMNCLKEFYFQQYANCCDECFNTKKNNHPEDPYAEILKDVEPIKVPNLIYEAMGLGDLT